METFGGYPLPDSNCSFIPNQYWDMVLPHYSRGVVRLVGTMLRQQMAWSDHAGDPQEPQTAFTWKELIAAGISRGAIGPALTEAVAGKLIRVQAGSRGAAGRLATPGLVALRWDDTGAYTKDPEKFQGFFGGEGNRTWIPNAFFDHTLKTETLSVVQVVGAVIRKTICWQDRYAHRVQEAALSVTDLQRLMGIKSRSTVELALETALAHQHLVRVAAGVFGAVPQAARYGLCWKGVVQKSIQVGSGSKIDTAAVQKSIQGRFKNQDGERFKNRDTCKESEKVLLNDPQTEAAAERKDEPDDLLVERMVAFGVRRPMAETLAEEVAAGVIEAELVHPPRPGIRNRAGAFVAACRNPEAWAETVAEEPEAEKPRYYRFDQKAHDAKNDASWAPWEAAKETRQPPPAAAEEKGNES